MNDNTEFAWELVRNAGTGLFRAELIEIEPNLVIWRGPWWKRRESALTLARVRLGTILREAGID